MTTPALDVTAPGLLTTVQDLGRWGWQHLGVPVGGAMDAQACRRANRLVGNDAGAAVLEVTLSGPELVARGDLLVGLSGGEFDAQVAGRAIDADVAVRVGDGEVLTIGRARQGARVWLAVAGGIAVTPVLGSRATTLGVLGGRPLRAGDTLPIGEVRAPGNAASRRPRPPEVVPAHPSPDTRAVLLRVIDGPDASRLGEHVLRDLCGRPWRLGAASNRMGYRLEGDALALPAVSLASSGTVMGMLQVPPAGLPVLLMADRQTTGGYPVPAVVIEADLPRAAQLAPGDWCRFRRCSRGEALAARLAAEQEWLDG